MPAHDGEQHVAAPEEGGRAGQRGPGARVRQWPAQAPWVSSTSGTTTAAKAAIGGAYCSARCAQ